MPTISAAKPIFTTPAKGLPTPRNFRFAGGETPGIPAQGAAGQANQSEVKESPLSKKSKEVLEKNLERLEKISPGFITRVGQRLQAFFKGLWNSIRLLFINKSNFALEKAQNELKNTQIRALKDDKYIKATGLDAKPSELKSILKDLLEIPEFQSTTKERAQHLLNGIEEREKSGQISAYIGAFQTEITNEVVKKSIKEA